VTSNFIYLAAIWIIPILIAIAFHEAAHGFVAHLLGNDTARRLGRVSSNPLKHVDPVGTILLPGILPPPPLSVLPPRVAAARRQRLLSRCCWPVGLS
jgi:Zn-dependent protease